MARKLVINAETGAQEYVDLTPEEEAERAAAAADHERHERRLATVMDLVPGPAIRRAVRDGAPLTAAQIEAVVRWIVARELPDATGGRDG